MKFLLVLPVLVLALVFSGCTQTPAPAGHETVVPPTSATPVAAVQLSSDSPGATLTLEPGILVVSFSTDTAQKMDISFLPVNETQGQATIFTTNGPYTGSVAFQVPAKGSYRLNITGTGTWNATTAPLATADPLKAPVNLSGAGTVVTPVFYLDKGEYIFERNTTGLSSPDYFLQFANGSYLMDANNTYPQPGFSALSPHPFVLVTIPENGIYYLSVLGRNNPGPWSVTISPVPKVPPMGPGPAIPGKAP